MTKQQEYHYPTRGTLSFMQRAKFSYMAFAVTKPNLLPMIFCNNGRVEGSCDQLGVKKKYTCFVL